MFEGEELLMALKEDLIPFLPSKLELLKKFLGHKRLFSMI